MSLYFLVIAETLAILLREDKDVKGLPIENIINLLNQFADDLDIFSEATESSIKRVFEILEYYYYQTGLKINYDKTTIYRIGSLRFSNGCMYTQNNVKWSNEEITVLGTKISHINVIEKNYDSLIEKANKTLNNWKN